MTLWILCRTCENTWVMAVSCRGSGALSSCSSCLSCEAAVMCGAPPPRPLSAIVTLTPNWPATAATSCSSEGAADPNTSSSLLSTKATLHVSFTVERPCVLASGSAALAAGTAGRAPRTSVIDALRPRCVLDPPRRGTFAASHGVLTAVSCALASVAWDGAACACAQWTVSGCHCRSSRRSRRPPRLL